jgi:hypothetical protein
LKINKFPDSPKDYVCTKFGQNPLEDIDPRVFTRMLRTDGRKKGRTDGRDILQWILTKLGTYLVLRRVWHPIDFQGHRSTVKVTW